MPEFDLLICGALNHPFIGIADGRVAALSEGSSQEVLRADGKLVLPGAIDAHVHFNEPGRAEWEGILTGSRACAAGGTTTFFDMPLNAHPPTIDGAAFDAKAAAAQGQAHVDFALWGGIVPENLDRLEELRERGVIGFKAFMSNSGIEDFPRADLDTLREGMRRSAELGLLVAVHAELERPARPGGTTVHDYLASRPIEIELDAIRAACEMAGETGCKLHIVHVSSAAGVALVAQARQMGVDVTCETCPHYLVLTEADMESLGAVAKCAPPLRSEPERRALLEQVRSGQVTTIGSDHSPSPASMKSDSDFFKVWGGISGCQHLLPLLFDLDLSAAQITLLTAKNVAERFRLAKKKGAIETGLDADLVIIDPNCEGVIEAEALFYRHRHTPYLGKKIRTKIVMTLLRGKVIYEHTEICGPPQGELLKPVL